MFKELFKPVSKISNDESNKDLLEKSQQSVSEIYQEEILPLIKIFQASDENLAECEARIAGDLQKIVENFQNTQNRATASPEESLKEMKEVLLKKSHYIITDLERKKYKTNLNDDERELLKKAKITLLSAGDLSDWHKSYGKNKEIIKESDGESLISYYLNAEKNNYTSNDGQDLRLTAAEVSALISGGLGRLLIKISDYKYNNLIKETPDDLLQLLCEKNDYSIVTRALENSPSPHGYSLETIKVLSKTKFSYLILKNISLFEKSLNINDFKDLIESYGPEYPYHLNDLLKYIKNTSYDEKTKDELIDFTFKHNGLTDKGFEDILSEKEAAKYINIKEEIKKITTKEDGWGKIDPENLSPEAIMEIKKYISAGYVTFFQEHYGYINYFLENDYDWLLSQLREHDQENFIISGQKGGSFKLEDQKIYAEKLISQDKTIVLNKMIEKSGVSKSILSPESYNKMMENGHIVSLEYLSGQLDEDSFIKIKEQRPQYLKNEELFKNIDLFKFNGDSQLGDYKNYQEFVAFIEKTFDLKNNLTLYKDLSLKMTGETENEEYNATSQERTDIFQEEITEKVSILKDKLPLLYPDNKEGKKPMELFGLTFGFKILDDSPENIEKFLDTLILLPNKLRQQNVSMFTETAKVIRDFNPEQKIEVKKNIEKMLEIFHAESHKDFFSRYLNDLKGGTEEEKISNMSSTAEIIPKYTLFFNDLSEQDKTFFQHIFPWSNSLAKIKIESEKKEEKKSLISLLENINKLVDLGNETDGELLVEYTKRFGINNLPKFFALFATIKRSSLEDGLDEKTIKTLENDFQIIVDDKKSIDIISDELQAVYQKIFTDNNELIKNNFLFYKSDSPENKDLYDYLKILALKGELKGDDNDLIINFFEKYLIIDKDDKNPTKKLQTPRLLFNELTIPLIKDNWGANLVAYIQTAEDVYQGAPENLKQEILNLFSGEYRDQCLNNMRQEWLNFLSSQNKDLPLRLGVISKTIETAGGAGNLKYIESLGDFVTQVDKSFNVEQTTVRTKDEMKKILIQIEDRCEKDKWSQDDKSQFYNLLKDTVEAAPSLFTSFAPLFEQISPKDLKFMFKNIMPLYQVELTIIQKINGDEGEVIYDPKDLVPIRQAITGLAANLILFPEDRVSILEEEKNRLLEVMKLGFKKRFGLIKAPSEFSKTELRSIQNCIRYAGNISGRNEERETLIALYLGLELNGEWDKFRQGQDIKVEDYLTPEKANLIKQIIEKKNNNKLPLEIIGIKNNELEKFQQILQEEVSNSAMSNIETVDVKLGNIKRNIAELLDSDIYEKEGDKELIKILVDNGKLVGAVLAKTYKNLDLNETEINIKNKLAKIFNISAWTGDSVKQIQDKIQPFSLITGMVKKLEEERVDENISELQKSLEPSEKIINIFNRLNEDFRPSSGAIALSADLEVLEKLAVKNDAKLSPEEKSDINKYLNGIKEQMIKLELIFKETKEYFDKVKKSSHQTENRLLQDRLNEIEKIVYSKGGEAVVTSRLTGDLNKIVENMRQCLGCLRKEANNDTNLAFGDYNKFFLMSGKEKEIGSIADEIVFFVPVKNQSGEIEMSFIMDRIYGLKSSDILMAHVLSIYKKYNTLKKEFKDAKISISVSSAALSSVGFNQELFQKIIKENFSEIKSVEYVEDMTADIPHSSLSDNYIEFGNLDSRKSGERIFSGVVIK